MIDNTWWEKIYQKTADKELPWERGSPNPYLIELVEKKMISPPGKVLDLGCGLGTQTIYLASVGFDTYGIDFSPSAIERAKKRAKEFQKATFPHGKWEGNKIHFAVGNVLELPFDASFFDFAFDFGCLHHNLSHAKEYEQEVNRVLKKRAYYLLFAFTESLTKSQIKVLFKGNFEIIEITPTTHIELQTGIPRSLWKVLMRKY